MNFSSYFQLLEKFAQEHLGEKDAVLITTSTMSSELELTRDMVVGLYEQYNRDSQRHFNIEKEFIRKEQPSEWSVRITRRDQNS